MKKNKKQWDIKNTIANVFSLKVGAYVAIIALASTLSFGVYDRYQTNQKEEEAKVLALEKEKERKLQEVLTLNQLIENNPIIQRIISEVLEMLKAHRVGLYFCSDYNKGIYLVKGGINGDKIVATNEVRITGVGSVMNELKEVDMVLMNPFISELIEKEGVLILDSINTPSNQQIIDLASNQGVQAIIWRGIYRKPESINSNEYLIGAIIIAYIKSNHTFTDDELAIIRYKCEAIAYLVENIYWYQVRLKRNDGEQNTKQ